MKGWRDKDVMPDRVREKVEQGNVSVRDRQTETEQREETVCSS